MTILEVLIQYFMSIHHRECPSCGAVVVGRSDKRFCSKSCRNQSSNATRKMWRERMAPYVNALLNNAKSLDTLLAGRKEAEVTNYDLMRVGFDPMSPHQKGFSFADGRETKAHFGPYVLVTISRNKFIIKNNN